MSMKQKIIYLTFLYTRFQFGSLSIPGSSQDPCSPGNHKLINEPHRSTLFVAESTDRLICDRGLIPGWYVFAGAEEIPTSCVTPYHCGTHAPIWMNGKNPTQADGVVQREACVNIGSNSGSTKCCDYKLNIQVKNCGTFMAYYLVRTPGCSIAYCAGNKRVCELGQSGTTSTCTDLYPKMTDFPHLDNPEVFNNKVRFPCHIPYPTGQKNVAFEVTWTVDGRELMQPGTNKPIMSTLTGDSRLTYLDVNNLAGNLGKTVKCNVTSYYTTSPGIRSDSLSSNGYWSGIRVSTDRLEVDEKGPEQEVTLESTLPIPCNAFNQNECKLSVELHGDRDPTDTSLTSCTYDLKLDPATGTFKTTFKVKATRDFINDNDKLHEIGFEPIFNLNQPVWTGYNVSSIHVQTKDEEHGHCIAHGDPHFSGFDYKQNYNIYETGDMVLYKSKNQKRPFEVQIRNWACGKFHPCICSVIAREGNDIVQVDMCEKRMNDLAAPELKVLSGSLEGTTISRDKSGKNFYINFPSGARVAIAAHLAIKGHEKDGYLNVDVQAPTDDLQNTEGLCGNWDKDPGDDFVGGDGVQYDKSHVPDFARSWLLKPGLSMFDQLPKYEQHLAPKYQYCSCKKNVVDCTKGKGANNPSKNVTEFMYNLGTIHQQWKRPVVANPYEQDQSDSFRIEICHGTCIPIKGSSAAPRSVRSYTDYYPDRDIQSNIRNRRLAKRDAQFPTPSGITESQARHMCTSALRQTTHYHRCQNLPSVDVNAVIESCVEDVKFADGDTFKLGHMDALDSLCQNELLKDVHNYHYDSQGEPIPASFISQTCPNQCSLQGTCVSGRCNCNHGYTSVDCSVPVGAAPVVHRIRGDGVCDVRGRPCQQANIIAENIMDVEELKCKFTLVSRNGDHIGDTTDVIVKGEFQSFLEVLCPLPFNNATNGLTNMVYQISVTTDGTAYSQPQKFVVYDSYCQQCENTGTCNIKTNACIIDNRCYRSGDQNNNHLVCDPSKTIYDWSTSKIVQTIDHYTASFTGCQCSHNPMSYDCACCQNLGCQCAEKQTNQCVDCQHLSMCGKNPTLFPVQN